MRERKKREWSGDRREREDEWVSKVLMPRELHCGNSEESVSGYRNNNSAHCERWQERSWEHIGLQYMVPVFLLGLLGNALLSIHERSGLPGFEFGFVVSHSLSLKKLHSGEIASIIAMGRAQQIFLRQNGPVQAAPLWIGH